MGRVRVPNYPVQKYCRDTGPVIEQLLPPLDPEGCERENLQERVICPNPLEDRGYGSSVGVTQHRILGQRVGRRNMASGGGGQREMIWPSLEYSHAPKLLTLCESASFLYISLLDWAFCHLHPIES